MLNLVTLCKQMTDVKRNFLDCFENLLLLDRNNGSYVTVFKQMSSGSFQNVTYKLFVYESYIFYVYKQDLAPSN